MGWFTNLFPVKLSCHKSAGGMNIFEVINAVSLNLAGVPNHGIGYGVIKYLSEFMETIPTNSPRISFNYLGQFDASFSNSLLEMANENIDCRSSLFNPMSHAMDLTALVLNNQLQVIFEYDANLINAETIEEVALSYEKNISEIIAGADSIYCDVFNIYPSLSIEESEITRLASLHPQNLQGIYPLLPTQKGMVFHNQYTRKADPYIVQWVLDFEGLIHRTTFEGVWENLFQEYPILRSRYHLSERNDFLCCVLKNSVLNIKYFDFKRLPEKMLSEQIENILIADKQKGYRLDQEPLVRIYCLTLPNNQSRVIVSHHHIILDGWSFSILIQRMMQLLERDKLNRSKVTGSDTLLLALQQIETNNLAVSQLFWRAYLAPMEAPSDLTIQNKTTVVNDNSRFTDGVDVYCREFEESLYKKLDGFCRQNELTLSVVLQVAWALLLSQYSGDNQVTFGFTFSGRSSNALKANQMVGLLINTVPVLVQFNDDLSLLAVCKKINIDNRQVERHSYLSIYQISEAVGKDVSFDSLLVVENHPLTSIKPLTGKVKLRNIVCHDASNYPLTLVFIPMDDSLQLKILYKHSLFEENKIVSLVNHLTLIFNTLMSAPETKYKDFYLLNNKQLEWLLQHSSGLPSVKDIEMSLAETFENAATAYPNYVAIQMKYRSLTYTELNTCASRWANKITQTHPDLRNKPVGIYTDCYDVLSIAIITIIKLGLPYVILDKSYPHTRLQYIVEDTQMNLILTDEGVERFESTPGFDLIHESYSKAKLAQYSAIFEPKKCVTTGEIAYIMYTSGSTGKPKGVQVAGRGVIRLVKETNYVKIHPGDKFLHTSSFLFDSFTFEFWGALLNGAS